MKGNFGLLPPLQPPVRNKRARYRAYADRALAALDAWRMENVISRYDNLV